MLNIFNFNQAQPVRVEMDESGVPWFIAKDVCGVLGIGKHRDAVSRLDDDERGSVLVDTLGGGQEMATISESGVYALIFRSRKPQAKAFRKWVTSEVLPSIRKTGGYAISQHSDPRQQWGRKLVADAVLEFEGVPMRVVKRDGGFRFVAVDCCKALGYARANIALQRLDASYKKLELLTDTMSRPRNMNTISLDGVLALTERCRLPRAQQFYNFMRNDALIMITIKKLQ